MEDIPKIDENETDVNNDDTEKILSIDNVDELKENYNITDDILEIDEEKLSSNDEQVIHIDTVTKKEKPIPMRFAKAAQKYTEKLEKQEQMIQSAKNKNSVNTKNNINRRSIKGKNDEKTSINQSRNARIAENKEERIQILREKMKENEDKIVTRADTIPSPKISRHKWAERAEVEKNTTRTAEPVGQIPHRYLRQMHEEQKDSHIKNVKSFSELRKVKAAENLGLDPRQTNATLHDLRKLKAERTKELRLNNTNNTSTEQNNDLNRIMGDKNMSKFAKAIALKKISPSKRVSIK